MKANSRLAADPRASGDRETCNRLRQRRPRERLGARRHARAAAERAERRRRSPGLSGARVRATIVATCNDWQCRRQARTILDAPGPLAEPAEPPCLERLFPRRCCTQIGLQAEARSLLPTKLGSESQRRLFSNAAALPVSSTCDIGPHRSIRPTQVSRCYFCNLDAEPSARCSPPISLMS